MSNVILGKIDCPVCSFDDVELKESAKGKPYFTCPHCQLQAFSRGEPSGSLMLKMIKQVKPIPEVSSADRSGIKEESGLLGWF